LKQKNLNDPPHISYHLPFESDSLSKY